MPRKFSIQFAEHLHQQPWWNPGACYVLALSGGMDSMALSQLMQQQDCTLILAHVNFKLRGAESDQDEAFVREQARLWKLPLETCTFDTPKYAAERKISIEMAARELRYAWFKTLCVQYSAQGILTAHHANDLAETVLLNMSRGMGVYGLDGIASQTDHLYRPLLFADREMIQHYIQEHHIPYREDSSNLEVNIPRNKIRHDVLPELLNINPRAIEHIGQSALRVQQMSGLYREYLEVLHAEFFISDSELDLNRLKQRKDASFLLFEFLRNTGMNGDQVKDLLTAREGARFYTETHQVCISRGILEITSLALSQETFMPVVINSPSCVRFVQRGRGRQICIEPYRLYAAEQLSADPMCVYVPVDQVQFPLTLRTWSQGDEFQPFGMKNTKKLSDFFVDEKYAPSQKQQQLLLCSQTEILWVVGSRLSETMRVRDIGQPVLRILIE